MPNNTARRVVEQDIRMSSSDESLVEVRPALPVAKSDGLSLRTILLLVLLSTAVHGGVIWWFNRPVERETPPKPNEIAIEFAAEPPPPPPAPPKPVEPPQKVEDDEAPKPPPKLRPKPSTPVPKPVEPPPRPLPTPSPPVEEVPHPTPPPAPVKETAAISGLSRLGNPSPPYPPLALRRMWEGRVELIISVTPEGTAESVKVKRSSGHEVLDDAAVETVSKWKFVPARRGDTPISGTATQVIEFKLPN